ncbi:YfdX family protein [Roseovarius sp. 2305UL8-3]|uniref:YfdX family protein n=1 Tax=Roseovarius conchicola TaxID=3121636 RepID=UPI0035285634
MKSQSTLKNAVLATSLGLGLSLSTAAFAEQAQEYPTQDEMLETADEALATLTGVHTARIALFNNKIEEAKDALENARTNLVDAESDLTSLMMRDFIEVDSKTNYLPFDMSMSLTEAFDATEENKLALQKAYGLFESAEPDEAVEVLRLAEIEVQVAAALLPYDETITNLDDAIGNIIDGDYFDANLELKAIEDSVILREFSIDAVPEQGDIQ